MNLLVSWSQSLWSLIDLSVPERVQPRCTGFPPQLIILLWSYVGLLDGVVGRIAGVGYVTFDTYCCLKEDRVTFVTDQFDSKLEIKLDSTVQIHMALHPVITFFSVSFSCRCLYVLVNVRLFTLMTHIYHFTLLSLCHLHSFF